MQVHITQIISFLNNCWHKNGVSKLRPVKPFCQWWKINIFTKNMLIW